MIKQTPPKQSFSEPIEFKTKTQITQQSQLKPIKFFKNPINHYPKHEQKKLHHIKLQIKEKLRIKFPKVFLEPKKIFSEQIYKYHSEFKALSNVQKAYSNTQLQIMYNQSLCINHIHHSRKKGSYLNIAVNEVDQQYLKKLQIAKYKDTKAIKFSILKECRFSQGFKFNHEGMIYFYNQIRRFINLKVLEIDLESSHFQISEKQFKTLIFTISKFNQLRKFSFYCDDLPLYRNEVKLFEEVMAKLSKLSDITFKLKIIHRQSWNEFGSVWSQIIPITPNLEVLSLQGSLDEEVELLFDKIGRIKWLKQLKFNFTCTQNIDNVQSLKTLSNLLELESLVINFYNFYSKKQGETLEQIFFQAISQLPKLKYLDFIINNLFFSNYSVLSNLPLSIETLKITTWNQQTTFIQMGEHLFQQLTKLPILKEFCIQFQYFHFKEASFKQMVTYIPQLTMLTTFNFEAIECLDFLPEFNIKYLLDRISCLKQLKNLFLKFQYQDNLTDLLFDSMSKMLPKLIELNDIKLEMRESTIKRGPVRKIDFSHFQNLKVITFKKLVLAISAIPNLKKLELFFDGGGMQQLPKDFLVLKLRTEIKKNIKILGDRSSSW